MNRLALEIDFKRDVKLHFKKICHQAVKESTFIRTGALMLKTKNVLKTSIVKPSNLEYDITKKFDKHIGVKFTKKEVIDRDENGVMIVDVHKTKIPGTDEVLKDKDGNDMEVKIPRLKEIEELKFVGKKPFIIVSTLRKIYEELSITEFKDLEEFFVRKMSKKNSVNKFINIVSRISSEKMADSIEKSSKRNFNLKTSSFDFQRYMSPPMGNNEFLLKVIDKDIIGVDK